MSNIYRFADEHPLLAEVDPATIRDAAKILGHKGAGLALMKKLGMPVPDGFTISIEMCRGIAASGIEDEVFETIKREIGVLESATGLKFGGDSSLLVSVRSGAEFSMPGMMDTILNLGFTEQTRIYLASIGASETFIFEVEYRFVAMWASCVLGLTSQVEDAAKTLAERSRANEARKRGDLEDAIVSIREAAVQAQRPIPDDPFEQLKDAISAVVQSWSSPRAIAYRAREHFSNDGCTAVTVQRMVFGNRDELSCSGAFFSRNPVHGEDKIYGEFQHGRQGEDLVQGIEAGEGVDRMFEMMPEVSAQLVDLIKQLEHAYKDVCEVEFTVESGVLWLLQSRIGKRFGSAAFRFAVDLTEEALIHRDDALLRLTSNDFDQVLFMRIGDGQEVEMLAEGLAASPGAAAGNVYLSAESAVRAVEKGEKVILVRRETSPSDIEGMRVSEGILTARGGLVSHAAVVARGWGKPAVVGVDALEILPGKIRIHRPGMPPRNIFEGDDITIDGSTGQVGVPGIGLTQTKPPAAMNDVLKWSADVIDAYHGLEVRVNADDPDSAQVAINEYGARGVGLCRSEQMTFTAPILTDLREHPSSSIPPDFVVEFRRAQYEDVLAMMRAVRGRPLTIRLLDTLDLELSPGVGSAAARVFRESNPSLGLRGVRIGLLHAQIYEAQLVAIVEACVALSTGGEIPDIEVMVPLAITSREFVKFRDAMRLHVEGAKVANPDNKRLQRWPGPRMGVMLETPRAMLRAGSYVDVGADFLSIGTNDLTQMTLGFSRDDIGGSIMRTYFEERLLDVNPFETIDVDGVGALLTLAMNDIRSRPRGKQIPVGVSGEHGGDKDSIAFFDAIKIDYVSASKYRVPAARLACAQAAIRRLDIGGRPSVTPEVTTS